MNFCQTVWWRTVIFLLNFKCSLLLVGCLRINCQGSLRVEPAPLFHMGTDLTVYCHTACINSSQLYLQVKNQEPEKSGNCATARLNLQVEDQEPGKRRNCITRTTTATFRLVNFCMTNSILECHRKSRGGRVDFICGLDLRGGYPPNKPTEISCQTIQSSSFIYCFWTRGQETYLNTTYNISISTYSFSKGNGTQRHYNIVQYGADNFSLAKALLNENEIQLTITAANDLGTSHSEPFILRVRDVVVLPDAPEIQNVQMESQNNSITVLLHWKPLEPSEHLRCHTRLRTLPKNGWVLAEQTELIRPGLIRLRGLDPLTEYEFQIRVCSSRRSLCGSWSPPAWAKTPEKESPVTVSVSESSQRWPSAGEGPPGNVIFLQPGDSEVGWWLAGVVVAGALFVMIVANLMCWSCLRNRVKKVCISVGPAWLVENLPKLGNSNAIKLLEQEQVVTESFWTSLLFTYSDPDMSPIEEISQELYPSVHTPRGLHGGSGQAETDEGNMSSERLLEHMGYKPQITTSDLQGDKESGGVTTTAPEQGEGCPLLALPGGLVGRRLSVVQADFSGWSLGRTLDFTPRMSSLLLNDREDRLENGGTESQVKMDVDVCLDVEESEELHETQSSLSQGMAETKLTTGYFPQRQATVSSTQCI